MKTSCLCAFALAAWPLLAAEWQWSVPVPSVTSEETKEPPRAFLWIPPGCERVRAAVVGQHNMLEEPLFESAVFRKALAELNFAEIWISPPLGGQERFGEREQALFEGMLSRLADASGYGELAQVPRVPVGHSAMADFPYLFAAQCPQRTLAAISSPPRGPVSRGRHCQYRRTSARPASHTRAWPGGSFRAPRKAVSGAGRYSQVR